MRAAKDMSVEATKDSASRDRPGRRIQQSIKVTASSSLLALLAAALGAAASLVQLNENFRNVALPLAIAGPVFFTYLLARRSIKSEQPVETTSDIQDPVLRTLIEDISKEHDSVTRLLDDDKREAGR
jgi:hypothetical protein